MGTVGNMAAPEFTMRLELAWDQEHKRWICTVIYRQGRGVRTRKSFVESGAPLDAWAVAHLTDAVKREMLSWLPYD